MSATAPATQTATPTFSDAVATWARIGVTSFGGPAGQIAMMHRVLVDEKRWLDERTYLTALSFCTLLPGPEAMQLATYAGWRLHGLKGGLVAGLLFVLPGAAVILALSILYALYGSLPVAAALFTGIKAAVLAIVLEALLRISRRSLKDTAEWLIAAAAFLAIFFLHVPFPVIIFVAGLIGYLRGRNSVPEGVVSAPQRAPVALADTAATIAVWTAIWIAPLALVAISYGPDHVLTKLGWFYSKLAVVTFGGAYAVLAYMAQDVVQYYGWLNAGEMLDGLGLAETTPGPLILVTEFVGFLAAYRSHAGGSILIGVAGALVTLWATFAPCFLWIFAGAPYIERIADMPRLKSALSAITAAVVGVILNLTVWFALHVIFRDVQETQYGPLYLSNPNLHSIDWSAAALAVLAGVLLFALHRGVITTLAICGGLGWLGSQLG